MEGFHLSVARDDREIIGVIKEDPCRDTTRGGQQAEPFENKHLVFHF